MAGTIDGGEGTDWMTLEGEATAQVILGEQKLTIDQEEDTTFTGVISGLGGSSKN